MNSADHQVKHERRVVGHASGWQEQMNTCICGEKWPCPSIGPDSISKISSINLRRCLRWHPDGINSWSLSDWAVALAGEVGELCNVVKKLNRERDGLVGNKADGKDLRTEMAKEVADVYLYLDLFCAAAGIDLPAAVRQKFNEVSERIGAPERL